MQTDYDISLNRSNVALNKTDKCARTDKLINKKNSYIEGPIKRCMTNREERLCKIGSLSLSFSMQL